MVEAFKAVYFPVSVSVVETGTGHTQRSDAVSSPTTPVFAPSTPAPDYLRDFQPPSTAGETLNRLCGKRKLKLYQTGKFQQFAAALIKLAARENGTAILANGRLPRQAAIIN